MIFTWMPVIFTFMLATFPAGLVIYWAWNNTLSVIQQYTIMRRQGVEVDLIGNIRDTFRRTPAQPAAAAATPAASKALPAPANDDDEDADAVPASVGNGKKPAKKTPAKKPPPKTGKASGRPRNAGA